MTCSTCSKCFKQADGSIIKRSERDGAFVYTLADGTVTATAPATFTNATEVDCTLFDQQVRRPEYDSEVMCESINGDETGVRVLVVRHIDFLTGAPVVAYYNLDGTAFTGDTANLVQCGNIDNPEADPREMCDGQTTFIRWYLLEDGEPTGTTFDTDLSGAPYAPVGTPVMGACTDQISVDYESACFRDPSSVDNLKINGSVVRTTNRVSGAVTVTYIDDDGNNLDKEVFIRVPCC